ncbi:hypothetical protein TCON_0578 [Astathelohania contejeani]|uniref:Protein YOP1 n=1 Tax=Astathelohania contejeani TaxID=164912 RepID=A0ABQ7I1A7_9MICR|nr:hypothetical protein TCON_0578 [Thelohania contejeani]
MDNIRKAAQRFKFLEVVETKTQGKVKQEYGLMGIGAFLLLTILFTPIGPLLTSTFGILIPLKETLTVLKQVKPKTEELRHLVIFWLFFGMLTAMDAYSSFVLSFIPFFYALKFAFLCWAGPLKFKAGPILYDNVLSKIPEDWYSFNTIESTLRDASQTASEAVKMVRERAKDVDENMKKTQ